MLSLHTGYDTSYLTDAVGTGAAAADYYTGAKGEPPGYWQGTGAAALGLAGLVDADVMRALYHEDVGPDGQVLVRRQRQVAYPAAGGSLYDRIEAEVAAQVAELGRFCTPEEERRIRLKERAKFRTRVPFYDFTFSAPKTVTVLWASLLAAAAEAAEAGDEAEAERLAERAEQVRGAVRRANDRMIAVMERESAYVRTGHHSAATGEWRDAQGFIVASFQQHDARDGAPQLHVHNAIANRAQRADGADAKWRSLDGTPLYRERLRYGTLADRFLAQELELLGIRTALREDGKALEVCGISEDAVDTYSTRAAEVRDRARELAADYEREHGHAPGKAAWYKIRQRAALETRDSKDHNPPAAGQQLRAWAGQAERSGIGKLSSLHEAVAEHAAEHEPSEVPGEAERASIIRQAVAAVQAVNASWHRAQLIFELGQALGALPGEVDPEAYLNGLADEALSGRAEGVNVVQIAPVPDVIDVTRLGLRKDGTSIYRKPGEARFVTAEHLDHEQHLVDIARLPLPQRITAEAAAAALEGTDLDHFQREACLGLLTARRLISCLVAPAGTGKTHVMAAFARIWAELAGGRVIGLTASTNAARVMAAEAAAAGAPMTTANIAQFLGKIKDSDRTRGHMPVYPGDVLIVDEASQVGTEDMLRIERVARQCGAMVVMVGDTEQLEAVDAGGIFRLIAARHGSWQLTEVRRFRSAWERDASLRLRRGEVAALAEYAARGRIYHGPQDRAYDDAVMLYLNGHLTGKESLLLATSNETAARLAALVRERLAERGLVGPAELTLADGNRAGQGDLIRARLNTRIDADGQTLANRDTIRIEGLAGTGPEQLAVVTRQTAPGSWSKPFFVQVRYLQHSAELAYAGNVHVAQGRTVDRAHLVVEGGANRSLLYTGMTRGREKNTAHVVTGAPDPAQPARAEREAFTDAALRQRAGLRQAGDAEAAKAVPLVMPARPSDRQMAPWEAIMAQALQQDEPERTALEEMAAAADFATHTGHLLQLSEAYWRLDVVPQIDEMIRQRLSPADYDRYRHDPERDALLQALREHEIGGREIPDVLDAITAEPMTGLRSIAAGLHGRLGKEPAPARGETTGWAERAPRSAPEPVAAAARMLDARQAELGRQLAERPPQWALQAWGAPPAEGAVRAEWERRAGLVGTYREAAGITDPAQAIGPVPSGQAQLREAFHASVVALELPDDQALLRAMGQGQLEAAVAAHDRAAALAPPDVQAQIGEREGELESAQDRAVLARTDRDTEAEVAAIADAETAAQDLARLAVADAARREWSEAHAEAAEAARAAEGELRRRGLAARIPVTDAEVAEAASQERETPPIDPELWARLKAQQTAEIEAARQARREAAEAAAAERDTPPVDPQEWARWKAEHAAEAAAAREARRTDRPEADAEPPEPVDPAWWAAAKAEQSAQIAAEREAAAAARSAAEADVPGHVDPALWEQMKAEQAAGREARQAARAETEAAVPSPVDVAWWERARAEQAAEQQAAREARREASARAYPVTDAEIARYGASEVHQDLQAIGESIRELSAQMDAEDARRERDREEFLRGPAPWEIQAQARAEAQAAAEASWQPGEHGDGHQAEADFEAEI
jgi:conjugative relaxase-like TrwC/TraI family protein